MILISHASGSSELSTVFASRGAEYKITQLTSADFVFTGNGPGDSLVQVGIERKTISELIGTMHLGRLSAKQIPKMLERYDTNVVIIEGIFRRNQDGFLEVWSASRSNPKGAWMPPPNHKPIPYNAISHYMMSLKFQGNVWPIVTRSYTETVDMIIDLQSWFNKSWELHSTFKTFHDDTQLLFQPEEPPKGDLAEWQRYICRMVAKELPGIGWDRSADVAQRFKTVREMVLADPGDWISMKGIGKIITARIMRALGG